MKQSKPHIMEDALNLYENKKVLMVYKFVSWTSNSDQQ
jgi:hypothetical protein